MKVGMVHIDAINSSPQDELYSLELIRNQLRKFDSIAALATAAGVELLIFPEFSMLNMNSKALYWNMEALKHYAFKIASPEDAGLVKQYNQADIEDACADIKVGSTATDLYYVLKSIAMRHKLTIAFNISELSLNDDMYNTSIVFEGTTGKLLTSYRKRNVWFTKVFKTPLPIDQYDSTFELNSRKFAMMTCYDIWNTYPTKSIDELDHPTEKEATLNVIYPVASMTFVASNVFSLRQRWWTKMHPHTLLSCDMCDSISNCSGIYTAGHLKPKEFVENCLIISEI